MLKLLTYYAQYYAHVKDLCVKSDCSIRIYSLVGASLIGASLSEPHINGVSSQNHCIPMVRCTYVTLIVSATYVILIVSTKACSYFSVI